MKRPFFLVGMLILANALAAQTANELITDIQSSQQKIRTAYYKVIRQDTFVTGQTRRSTGEVKIRTIPADGVFGFAYWGRKDGINREAIYDGKMVFEIDHDKKMYESTSNASMIEHSLGSPGGQMVITDLARLDTSHAQEIGIAQDGKYYYLTIHLPDIKEYDVIKRVRTITVDKKLMIPVAVRSRQETLGKVQDIYYEVSDIKLNDEKSAYDFASERVPASYARRQDTPNKKLKSLEGNMLPSFALTDFDNKDVTSDGLKGKVILLDFWEVWCGPCVASMPKVQELEKRYAEKGLAVLGMMSEKEQLEVAKLMVKKRDISFPMLQSNAQTNKTFGVIGIPTYVLVDRNGIVRFTSEGFSEDLEREILRLL